MSRKFFRLYIIAYQSHKGWISNCGTQMMKNNSSAYQSHNGWISNTVLSDVESYNGFLSRKFFRLASMGPRPKGSQKNHYHYLWLPMKKRKEEKNEKNHKFSLLSRRTPYITRKTKKSTGIEPIRKTHQGLKNCGLSFSFFNG